ncbi:MAG: TRAP transporter substrate-binding protein [Alphaproteobacteria bacterium]|nr:TRAP transporter substrate-binding protein [Alphaproteobacteria bacterium]
MKRRQLVAAGAASAPLGAMISLGARAQARQIKINTISAANSPWAEAMKRFAELVEKESGGRLKVLVYTDGQLGDLQQTMAGMQLGTIEMAYLGLGVAVFLKGGEAMKLIYTPYLFNSKDQARRVLNSPEFLAIYDDVARKTNVRIFGAHGDRSPRAVQSTKGPILRPEDLKGLRLRVPPADIFSATFEAVGAQITPLGMTEIYTALARGIVDGQDNGFDLSIPLKFHEVAKHWSQTDHVYELTGWYASERVWQGFSPADRTLLGRAAAEAGMLATQLMQKLDDDGIAILKAAGVNVVTPDREAFRKAMADVPKRFEGKDWPAGMVERIRAMG